MEKEMKKLLLVAVSVGVFLLVTISAAVVMLSPKGFKEEVSYSSSKPYQAGSISKPVETVGITENRTPQSSVIQETVKENTSVVSISDRSNGDSYTINVPKPTAAAIPDVIETPKQAIQKPVTTQAQTNPPAASRPAVSTQPAKTTAPAAAATKPAAAPKPAATPKPAAAAQTKPAVQSKAINDFWVQTGAFSAIVRAEDVKEKLASNGFISIIENRVVNGALVYRVRLGPYTSEKEANYWLTLVKSINGFEDSQVRQTVRQQ